VGKFGGILRGEIGGIWEKAFGLLRKTKKLGDRV